MPRYLLPVKTAADIKRGLDWRPNNTCYHLWLSVGGGIVDEGDVVAVASIPLGISGRSGRGGTFIEDNLDNRIPSIGGLHLFWFGCFFLTNRGSV